MEEKCLYFDVAATTQVRPEVLKVMQPYLTTKYGNASSQYELGIESKAVIDTAREIISNMLKVTPEEIFFTSGGSEANTWALTRYEDNGKSSIISPIEHHSVINAACSKSTTHMCKVDRYGFICVSDLMNKINDSVCMISTMFVNNEVGTIEPIERIASICEDNKFYYHVDAVQAFGHIPIDLANLHGITSMSASAHKIGGPKGIGFLYIRKDIQKKYRPLIYGGKQEFSMRGGTENVAAIIGFAEACSLASVEMKNESNSEHLRSLISYAWHFIRDNVPNTHLNGFLVLDNYRVPHILNISFDGISGEELVTLLGEQKIYVSTGSACNSGTSEPSHVLKAIGLSDARANSSIRISFDLNTTKQDINILCQKIIEDVEILRR